MNAPLRFPPIPIIFFYEFFILLFEKCFLSRRIVIGHTATAQLLQHIQFMEYQKYPWNLTGCKKVLEDENIFN